MEQQTMLELTENWNGFQPIGRRRPADWDLRLARTVALLENHDGYSSRQWGARIEEAATTSDFPLLFADSLDRQMLAAYRARPKVMRRICRVASIRDFRTVKRFAFNGLLGRLQQVEELGEYQHRKRKETAYEYALAKWGAKVPFSWEAWLNDDLGSLANIGADLAMAADATEDWYLTSLFWDADGPLDAYFDVANVGQDGVSNLPLTLANLATAIQEMMGDAKYAVDGTPVVNVPKYLVVPPALQTTAADILRSVMKAWTDGTGAGATSHETVTTIGQYQLELVINPWIPHVVTTGTIGSTTWALFSETIRPAELGLLQGHEAPELFVKTSGAQMLSGGEASPMNGSFENDAIEYKERYVFNATRLDPRGGWASDGQ